MCDVGDIIIVAATAVHQIANARTAELPRVVFIAAIIGCVYHLQWLNRGFQRSIVTVTSVSLILLAATAALLGGYLLIRCILSLGRMVFPKVRVRFSASGEPFRMTIPQPGRYVINVLIPPFSVFTGVSHFDAMFSVATYPSGASLDFRSYGRSLFHVKRTDMTGKQAVPLGSFECAAPSEILITCENPEVIRTNYLLEVSPHVPPFIVVLIILATIASSAMVIGGFVFSILLMSGKV